MSDSTYFFDPTGREPFSDQLKSHGYVELPEYEASDHCYCCANCPYMKEQANSPTGYFCEKIKAPDRPNGCCDKWEPLRR